MAICASFTLMILAARLNLCGTALGHPQCTVITLGSSGGGGEGPNGAEHPGQLPAWSGWRSPSQYRQVWTLTSDLASIGKNRTGESGTGGGDRSDRAQ